MYHIQTTGKGELLINEEFFEEVLAAQENCGNAYHNARHVRKMLEGAGGLYYARTITYNMYCMLRVAILYHDYKYVPGELHNEANAAGQFLRDYYKIFIPAGASTSLHVTEIESCICNAILATKDHYTTNDLSHHLIDLDLMDLRQVNNDAIRENTIALYDEALTCNAALGWAEFIKDSVEFMKSYRGRIGDKATTECIAILLSMGDPAKAS